MPTRYYNQPTERELHFKSLEAANKFAELAQELCDERPDLTYTQAAEIIARRYPTISEECVKGYSSEEESRQYSMTSYEAANKISDLATELMRKERIPYAEAANRILSDPANREIARCYSKAD